MLYKNYRKQHRMIHILVLYLYTNQISILILRNIKCIASKEYKTNMEINLLQYPCEYSSQSIS